MPAQSSNQGQCLNSVFLFPSFFQGPLRGCPVQRAPLRGVGQHAAGHVPAQGQGLGGAVRPHLRAAQGRAQEGVPDLHAEVPHIVSRGNKGQNINKWMLSMNATNCVIESMMVQDDWAKQCLSTEELGKWYELICPSSKSGLIWNYSCCFPSNRTAKLFQS